MRLERPSQPVVVDSGDDEVGVLRLEAEQLVADGTADEIRVESQAADELLDCAVHRLRQCDGLDLDECAGRKLGDLDGRAGGRLVAHVLLVHLVHAGKVVQALEEDRRLDEAVEPAAGGFENGAEIRERLLGLLLNRVADDLRVIRPERELAGNEDEPRRLDRL